MEFYLCQPRASILSCLAMNIGLVITEEREGLEIDHFQEVRKAKGAMLSRQFSLTGVSRFNISPF
jgi:hypothetical protein